MRDCHSAGPVVWTLVPRLSTATVTGMSTTSNSESMQSCGVFKQRQQAGVGLRVGESPGANGEMHLPEWR